MYKKDSLETIISKIDFLHSTFLNNLDIAPEIQVFSLDPYKSLIEANKQKLSELISLETGKSKIESGMEVDKTLKHILYYHNYFLKYDETYYGPQNLFYGEIFNRFLPTGVLLKIVPYNYPLWLAFKFIVPNICVGNPVLLRPPSTCLKLYQFLNEEIQRNQIKTSRISFFDESETEKIIAHPKISGVSFTGGISAGNLNRKSYR